MGLQDLVGDKRKTNTIAVKGSSKSKHVLWNLVTFSVTFLTSVEEEEKKKAAASQSYIFCICPAALRGPHFALSHQPQGQMGEWRQVSTRSHCPFLWDEGEAGSCRGKVC